MAEMPPESDFFPWRQVTVDEGEDVSL